jgi:hypothetical protein
MGMGTIFNRGRILHLSTGYPIKKVPLAYFFQIIFSRVLYVMLKQLALYNTKRWHFVIVGTS